MIPAAVITKWSVTHPWSTREQIEQDLLLSQAMCEVSNDQLLGFELVLRGGTAFHKLFLPKPHRYSEDLDYVRTSAGGIGDIMKRLTSLGSELGYIVSTRMGQFPKIFWKTTAESGLPLRIKIEINTFERSPSLPLALIEHTVDTDWYSSRASIKTFQVEELVATKLRALYQRSKGRDLFDLWLAIVTIGLEPSKIIKAYEPYRPDKTSSQQMIENLEAKLNNMQFLSDTDGLVISNDHEYNPGAAAKLVIEKLLTGL
ncbi:MAG: nucleotidyl transferase AbiEii/AbiGii toxin family protein [Coriobacteriia bacterium]|nr:nucleotidyl transferase AbiEii/AbiGii toxin family protein [Coriobacteriia bacterium]